MNPRFTRTRDMILDDAVPRLESGGVALCHICQRSVYFAGGFMQVLVNAIERGVRYYRPSGACPRCGAVKLYFIQRHDRIRCSECRHEWNPKCAPYKSAKKPKSWYDQITELHRQGINPYRISKIMGAGDSKSIAAFVKRLMAFDRLSNCSVTEGELRK